MYKPSTHLVVTYFPTDLPIYETLFLQDSLPRWNQILTQLRFIDNWVIMGIQWMVSLWMPVQWGRSPWPHRTRKSISSSAQYIILHSKPEEEKSTFACLAQENSFGSASLDSCWGWWWAQQHCAPADRV